MASSVSGWKSALAVCAALAGWSALAVSGIGRAAETADPIAMSKTLIVLKLDTEEPLSIRTSFRAHPPTITLEFPRQRVIGSLPERSAISKGVIETIAARYDAGPSARPRRFLQSLQVVLSAPYPYHVRSEPGRIVIDIDHPASVSSAAVEVALRGGTIIAGVGQRNLSERFRAMQEALARATPIPWSFQITQERGISPPVADEVRAAQRLVEPPSQRSHAAPAVAPTTRPPRLIPWRPEAPSSIMWVLIALILALGGVVGFRLLSSWTVGVSPRSSAQGWNGQVSSGLVLIDQLVWRAFEQQGYELMAETTLTQPLTGTLRIIVKDGSKAALLFVCNGSFFERQTVQRFIQLMRNANTEQGVLAAAGSFTVPAQRIAQEHHIALIGRDQLTALLGVGANSESAAKQLEEQRTHLEGARESLRQFAEELDTLRRQRNEASWFLGEERAKSAKLEAQAAELSQQLSRQEADLQRWEEEASALRKQWEESQWYLGESRLRVGHLEAQLTALQELAKRVETAEHERDAANWYLGEERARSEVLEARLAELQRPLEASTTWGRQLEATLDQLKQELSVLRTVGVGERRNQTRRKVPHVQVEMRNGQDEPIFSGSPRDVSSGGVGLESDRELPALPSVQMCVSFPGHDPIESKAHVVWQRAIGGTPPRYQSGYQLVGISRATRVLIDQIIKST